MFGRPVDFDVIQHRNATMVMAYQQTKEDRLLVEKPYRLWNGTKIDIRWKGGWLTPSGKFIPIDYKNGITHETIAEEHGSRIQGSGSITSRPPMVRLFDLAEWMRITYFEYSSFCVEFKGSLVGNRARRKDETEDDVHEYNTRRQFALLTFVRDYSRFDQYYINNAAYDSFKHFKTAIGANSVTPRSH